MPSVADAATRHDLMTKKAITLVSVSLALGASLAFVGGVGHAAPPVQAGPAPRPTAAPGPAVQVKRMTKMTTQATAAVAGETRNVKATLQGNPDNGPIAGKMVTFKLSGTKPNGQQVLIVLGSDATNAQGEATLAWKVTELGQAAYKLTATFAGDDNTAGSSDDANFGIIKGISKIELGNVTYGALDSHGGPKFHTIILTLRRESDGAAISRPVKVTINGALRTVTPNPISQLLLQPDNASQWTVKAQFEGDDSYQATAAERTYNRVPGS